MSFLSKSAAALIVGGFAAGALGFGAATSVAQPPPPPPGPAEFPPNPPGEPVPNWAPRKPAEMWNGEPVVWTSMWGGRWGVWKHGQFITLSSNPVTNGG
ncbi:hypothetical protein FK535_02800 [Mycolicibacterium sp. 018/SC-01/001]|uniref:hypothetical protein n=1 Tax=Mycolicibacterium sp. 018/SC-01/001 TaxID=2592069 RepID=UPI00118092FB|nr:hypothetical protein [Mycolicibacterium sp. 018/SC-01/001]TRW89195.1 hypothetical protein FK535_02800 [Mycolicibacterium sp. 018/SC-01/001]